MAADVYAAEAHVGRGGWSWYTGSAGWMYRLLTESLLGLRREGDRLHIEPRVPDDWRHWSADWRHGSTHYRSAFARQTGDAGVAEVSVDGVPQADHAITLVDDGHPHAVRVRFGKTVPPTAVAADAAFPVDPR
jgi:cellobiose phosphorylase